MCSYILLASANMSFRFYVGKITVFSVIVALVNI